MNDRRGAIAGIMFIAIGLVFLLDELEVLELRIAYLFPLAVIFVGVWIMFAGARRRGAGR